MGIFSSFHSNIFSTHENQCGSCGMSSVDTNRLRCYCNKNRSYYPLNSPKCRHYVKDNSRDYNYWKNIYTYHISTAICYILGIKNESVAFESIKELREYLEKDDSKRNLLELYDVYGPILAECIKNDPNSVLVCEELLTTYIAKTAILVRTGNMEEAFKVYLQMILKLLDRYKNFGFNSNIINENNFYNQKVLTKVM